MNKIHVLLLSVLVPVVLYASEQAPADQDPIVSDNISMNSQTSKAEYSWRKFPLDAFLYKYAPDIVGRVGAAGNFIMRNKVHVPACITNVINGLPNAVNKENVNRIVSTGLLYGGCNYAEGIIGENKSSSVKKSAKTAVNEMKDATVAITAIEALSWLGNKLGGERAEQFAENYAEWVSWSKAIGYAFFKKASQAYTPSI